MPTGKDDEPDLFDYGTEPYKLYRKDGLDTSEEAAYGVDTTRLEREVHEVIKTFGKDGCISDEVLARFPLTTPYSSVTARYAALETKGHIFRLGKRPGKSTRAQYVMRDMQYRGDFPDDPPVEEAAAPVHHHMPYAG